MPGWLGGLAKEIDKSSHCDNPNSQAAKADKENAPLTPWRLGDSENRSYGQQVAIRYRADTSEIAPGRASKSAARVKDELQARAREANVCVPF